MQGIIIVRDTSCYNPNHRFDRVEASEIGPVLPDPAM